jgi:hypothetical protein
VSKLIVLLGMESAIIRKNRNSFQDGSVRNDGALLKPSKRGEMA